MNPCNSNSIVSSSEGDGGFSVKFTSLTGDNSKRVYVVSAGSNLEKAINDTASSAVQGQSCGLDSNLSTPVSMNKSSDASMKVLVTSSQSSSDQSPVLNVMLYPHKGHLAGNSLDPKKLPNINIYSRREHILNNCIVSPTVENYLKSDNTDMGKTEWAPSASSGSFVKLPVKNATDGPVNLKQTPEVLILPSNNERLKHLLTRDASDTKLCHLGRKYPSADQNLRANVKPPSLGGNACSLKTESAMINNNGHSLVIDEKSNDKKTNSNCELGSNFSSNVMHYFGNAGEIPVKGEGEATSIGHPSAYPPKPVKAIICNSSIMCNDNPSELKLDCKDDVDKFVKLSSPVITSIPLVEENAAISTSSGVGLLESSCFECDNCVCKQCVSVKGNDFVCKKGSSMKDDTESQSSKVPACVISSTGKKMLVSVFQSQKCCKTKDPQQTLEMHSVLSNVGMNDNSIKDTSSGPESKVSKQEMDTDKSKTNLQVGHKSEMGNVGVERQETTFKVGGSSLYQANEKNDYIGKISSSSLMQTRPAKSFIDFSTDSSESEDSDVCWESDTSMLSMPINGNSDSDICSSESELDSSDSEFVLDKLFAKGKMETKGKSHSNVPMNKISYFDLFSKSCSIVKQIKFNKFYDKKNEKKDYVSSGKLSSKVLKVNSKQSSKSSLDGNLSANEKSSPVVHSHKAPSDGDVPMGIRKGITESKAKPLTNMNMHEVLSPSQLADGLCIPSLEDFHSNNTTSTTKSHVSTQNVALSNIQLNLNFIENKILKKHIKHNHNPVNRLTLSNKQDTDGFPDCRGRLKVSKPRRGKSVKAMQNIAYPHDKKIIFDAIGLRSGPYVEIKRNKTCQSNLLGYLGKIPKFPVSIGKRYPWRLISYHAIKNRNIVNSQCVLSKLIVSELQSPRMKSPSYQEWSPSFNSITGKRSIMEKLKCKALLADECHFELNVIKETETQDPLSTVKHVSGTLYNQDLENEIQTESVELNEKETLSSDRNANGSTNDKQVKCASSNLQSINEICESINIDDNTSFGIDSSTSASNTGNILDVDNLEQDRDNQQKSNDNRFDAKELVHEKYDTRKQVTSVFVDEHRKTLDFGKEKDLCTNGNESHHQGNIQGKIGMGSSGSFVVKEFFINLVNIARWPGMPKAYLNRVVVSGENELKSLEEELRKFEAEQSTNKARKVIRADCNVCMITPRNQSIACDVKKSSNDSYSSGSGGNYGDACIITQRSESIACDVKSSNDSHIAVADENDEDDLELSVSTCSLAKQKSLTPEDSKLKNRALKRGIVKTAEGLKEPGTPIKRVRFSGGAFVSGENSNDMKFSVSMCSLPKTNSLPAEDSKVRKIGFKRGILKTAEVLKEPGTPIKKVRFFDGSFMNNDAKEESVNDNLNEFKVHMECGKESLEELSKSKSRDLPKFLSENDLSDGGPGNVELENSHAQLLKNCHSCDCKVSESSSIENTESYVCMCRRVNLSSVGSVHVNQKSESNTTEGNSNNLHNSEASCRNPGKDIGSVCISKDLSSPIKLLMPCVRLEKLDQQILVSDSVAEKPKQRVSDSAGLKEGTMYDAPLDKEIISTYIDKVVSKKSVKESETIESDSTCNSLHAFNDTLNKEDKASCDHEIGIVNVKKVVSSVKPLGDLIAEPEHEDIRRTKEFNDVNKCNPKPTNPRLKETCNYLNDDENSHTEVKQIVEKEMNLSNLVQCSSKEAIASYDVEQRQASQNSIDIIGNTSINASTMVPANIRACDKESFVYTSALDCMTLKDVEKTIDQCVHRKTYVRLKRLTDKNIVSDAKVTHAKYDCDMLDVESNCVKNELPNDLNDHSRNNDSIECDYSSTRTDESKDMSEMEWGRDIYKERHGSSINLGNINKISSKSCPELDVDAPTGKLLGNVVSTMIVVECNEKDTPSKGNVGENSQDFTSIQKDKYNDDLENDQKGGEGEEKVCSIPSSHHKTTDNGDLGNSLIEKANAKETVPMGHKREHLVKNSFDQSASVDVLLEKEISAKTYMSDRVMRTDKKKSENTHTTRHDKSFSSLESNGVSVLPSLGSSRPDESTCVDTTCEIQMKISSVFSIAKETDDLDVETSDNDFRIPKSKSCCRTSIGSGELSSQQSVKGTLDLSDFDNHDDGAYRFRSFCEESYSVSNAIQNSNGVPDILLQPYVCIHRTNDISARNYICPSCGKIFHHIFRFKHHKLKKCKGKDPSNYYGCRICSGILKTPSDPQHDNGKDSNITSGKFLTHMLQQVRSMYLSARVTGSVVKKLDLEQNKLSEKYPSSLKTANTLQSEHSVIKLKGSSSKVAENVGVEGNSDLGERRKPDSKPEHLDFRMNERNSSNQTPGHQFGTDVDHPLKEYTDFVVEGHSETSTTDEVIDRNPAEYALRLPAKSNPMASEVIEVLQPGISDPSLTASVVNENENVLMFSERAIPKIVEATDEVVIKEDIDISFKDEPQDMSQLAAGFPVVPVCLALVKYDGDSCDAESTYHVPEYQFETEVNLKEEQDIARKMLGNRILRVSLNRINEHPEEVDDGIIWNRPSTSLKAEEKSKSPKHRFIVIDGRRVYPCQECGHRSSCSSDLKRHVRVHTGERPYKCLQCNRSYRQRGALNAHMDTHLGIKHICPICRRGLSQRAHLADHMKIHTGERPHKCDICEKTFVRKDHLKVHSFIHDNTRPFKCYICPKAFNNEANLKSHLRYHSNDRRYKCSVCTAAFVAHFDLKRHLLTHKNQKPQICPVCGKSYKHSFALKKHLSTAHTDFVL